MVQEPSFFDLDGNAPCRNIPVLAKTHTVYALDMIGYGRSDKPPEFVYTMETWAEVRHTIYCLV